MVGMVHSREAKGLETDYTLGGHSKVVGWEAKVSCMSPPASRPLGLWGRPGHLAWASRLGLPSSRIQKPGSARTCEVKRGSPCLSEPQEVGYPLLPARVSRRSEAWPTG